MAAGIVPRPLDFSIVGGGRSLGTAELARMAGRTPFLHWLLTTEGLTTAALEARCGCRLRSQREVGVVGGRLARRHLLLDGMGRAVECAEVGMGTGHAAWATLREALGPWLAAGGWRVRKRQIRPMAFPNHGSWLKVFPEGRSWFEVFGRSYFLEASLGGEGVCLEVIEAWNPAIVGW